MVNKEQLREKWREQKGIIFSTGLSIMNDISDVFGEYSMGYKHLKEELDYLMYEIDVCIKALDESD